MLHVTVVVLPKGDEEQSSMEKLKALKANAIRARQIAKQYNCAVFYMSQLSADAEGRSVLNQSMMEGSRTGKAAEADLMLLIGKAPSVEGQEESPIRNINVVKRRGDDCFRNSRSFRC